MKKQVFIFTIIPVVSFFCHFCYPQTYSRITLDSLKSELKVDFKNPETHYLLAKLYNDKEEYYYKRQAEYHFQKALTYENTNMNYMKEYAYFKLRSHRYEDAFYYFKKILDEDSTHLPAYSGLLTLFNETGNSKALKILITNRNYEKFSIEKQVEFMQALIKHDEILTGKKLASVLLESNPDNGVLLYYLSRLFLKEKDYQSFCSYYIKGINHIENNELLENILIEISDFFSGNERINIDSLNQQKGRYLHQLIKNKDPDDSTVINEALVDYFQKSPKKTSPDNKTVSAPQHENFPDIKNAPVVKKVLKIKKEKANKRTPSSSGISAFSGAKELYEKGEYREALKILKKLEGIKASNRYEVISYLFLTYFSLDNLIQAEKYAQELIGINSLKGSIPDIINREAGNFLAKIRKNSFVDVEIKSEPDDALIYINGEKKGVTPDFMTLPVNQTFQVDLLKEDHETTSFLLETRKSENFNIMKKLKLKEGKTSLSLVSPTEGVEVFLNNSFLGTLPYYSVKILPGYHTFTFEKEGYKTAEQLIFVKPNEKNEITIQLKKIKDYIIYSEFVPGLGQIVAGHKLRGGIFLFSSISYFFIYNHNVNNKPKLFSYSNPDLKKESRGSLTYYFDGKTPITREEYYDEFEKINRSIESMQKLDKYDLKRSRMLLGGFCIYLLNILDIIYISKKEEHIEKSGFKISAAIEKEKIEFVLKYGF